MRIGILGTGGMADALGTQWARAGHEVMISGRNPDKAAALAAKLTTARTGTWAQAAEFGDVVLAALPVEALREVLQAAGPALRDKPLIDVANGAGPDAYDPARPIADMVREITGARVVKAFNLGHVDVWRMTPPVFGGRPLAVPLCGDDEEALAAVRHLVTDLGCTPVDGGGLRRARLLEATAAFVIGLWFGGVDAQAILTPQGAAGVPLSV
ncbi:NAD(P)-binding domain-containing protein [Nonomuraea sp. NPDC000554]|uniref:NADPH-dependent F420 reductase n=1 Tax=Nonomuraea sp. NPDC000554 TaxID=3154259 RepID=UPI00332C8EE9